MLLHPSLHFLTVTVPASPPPKIKRYTFPGAKYSFAKLFCLSFCSSVYGARSCFPSTITTASMLPSPDSAETAKTTTPLRGWAAVVAPEFPPRGADTISADETNSRPNRRRLQLFVNTVALFLTLDHSFSIRSVRTPDIIHCEAAGVSTTRVSGWASHSRRGLIVGPTR